MNRTQCVKNGKYSAINRFLSKFCWIAITYTWFGTECQNTFGLKVNCTWSTPYCKIFLYLYTFLENFVCVLCTTSGSSHDSDLARVFTRVKQSHKQALQYFDALKFPFYVLHIVARTSLAHRHFLCPRYIRNLMGMLPM